MRGLGIWPARPDAYTTALLFSVEATQADIQAAHGQKGCAFGHRFMARLSSAPCSCYAAICSACYRERDCWMSDSPSAP